MRHPLLREAPQVAPFIDDIEAKTGIRLEWQAQDEFGRDFGEKWRWFHAVDLCTDKHWRDLLATEQFTDRDCIFNAVRHGLEFKSLSLKNARSVMAHLDAVEPEDRSAQLLNGKGLSPYRHEKGKLISPNVSPRGEEGAWLVIHGLEDGWLTYSGKFLSMTEAGMDRRSKAKEVDIPLPLGDDVMDDAAPAVEFHVGGLEDGNFAALSVYQNTDKTFSFSLSYEVCSFGDAWRRAGQYQSFGSAMQTGMLDLRDRLTRIALDFSAGGRANARAAAVSAVAWIDDYLDKSVQEQRMEVAG